MAFFLFLLLLLTMLSDEGQFARRYAAIAVETVGTLSRLSDVTTIPVLVLQIMAVKVSSHTNTAECNIMCICYRVEL